MPDRLINNNIVIEYSFLFPDFSIFWAPSYFFIMDIVSKVKEQFDVQLRPFQRDALQALLDKKDVFVAVPVPTGKCVEILNDHLGLAKLIF